MIRDLTLSELKEFSWPSPYSWRDDCLLYEDEVLFSFQQREGGLYAFSCKEIPCKEDEKYFYNIDVIYEEEKIRYFLLSMLGKELPSFVMGGRVVSPHIWKEFISIKNKVKAKHYLYNATKRRGLAIIADDTGNWVQKIFAYMYPLYTGQTLYFENRITDDKYMYYEGLYYPNEGPFYEIAGTMRPISFIIHNVGYCEDHGYYIGEECTACAHRYEIRRYGTKAEDIFPFKDDGEKNPVYMGIELEYEDCLNQRKAVVDALKDHVIIKADGSIRYGFEICTAPATIGVHKKAFQDFFGKAKLAIKSNCGMHVHVDRRKMGELQLGKLLSFMYKKDNESFITVIAGRNFAKNYYCRAEVERGVTDNFSSRTDFYQKRVRVRDRKSVV